MASEPVMDSARLGDFLDLEAMGGFRVVAIFQYLFICSINFYWWYAEVVRRIK